MRIRHYVRIWTENRRKCLIWFINISIADNVVTDNMSKSLSSQSKIGFYFPQLHSSLPHNSTLIPQSDRTRQLFIRLIFNDICKKLIFGIRFAI